MGEAKRRKVAGEYPDTSKRRPVAATVSWDVVGDIGAHKKAQQMLDILGKLSSEYQDGGGNTMVVVLEDQTRQPIICAQTRGLGAFMALIDELQELGLTDRLEGQDEPENGVDAAFF